MANGFGYTFSPAGRKRFSEGNQKSGPGRPEHIGEALQVLSLRLPKVLGGRAMSPSDLLNARGGPGPGAVAETLGRLNPNDISGASGSTFNPSLPPPSAAPGLMVPPSVGGSASPFQQITHDPGPGMPGPPPLMSGPRPPMPPMSAPRVSPGQGAPGPAVTRKKKNAPRVQPGITNAPMKPSVPSLLNRSWMDNSGPSAPSSGPSPTQSRFADKYDFLMGSSGELLL